MASFRCLAKHQKTQLPRTFGTANPNHRHCSETRTISPWDARRSKSVDALPSRPYRAGPIGPDDLDPQPHIIEQRTAPCHCEERGDEAIPTEYRAHNCM